VWGENQSEVVCLSSEAITLCLFSTFLICQFLYHSHWLGLVADNSLVMTILGLPFWLYMICATDTNTLSEPTDLKLRSRKWWQEKLQCNPRKNLSESLCGINLSFFLKRFIAKKVCTACSRTGYKIVRLTELNKYLHHDRSETDVNINK
jgi:hypothetical protein